MRPSPRRHPLAVLRHLIGLGQKEMAKLCNCSTRTIQAVELLHLPLSEDLAQRIAGATRVSAAWLLDGDPLAPAVTNDVLSSPFTKETFEAHAGRLSDVSVPALNSLIDSFIVYNWTAALDSALASAKRSRKDQVLRYRVEKFLEQLKKDFGQDTEVLSSHARPMGRLAQLVLDFFNPWAAPPFICSTEADDTAVSVSNSGTTGGSRAEAVSSGESHRNILFDWLEPIVLAGKQSPKPEGSVTLEFPIHLP